MDDASLYKRSDQMQRRDAREVLNEFGKMINWRTDGHDSLLDIGCASGDVTHDYILPMLPLNFDRLIGDDLSEKMVSYARKHNSSAKVSFVQFDVGGDAQDLLKQMEPVDHITSFYCLHWLQNQKKVLENIYSLLKVDGDCLLMFPANHPVFQAYDDMSRTAEWGEYSKDFERFCSLYQNSKNVAHTYEELLKSCNFKEYRVEIRDKTFEFDDAKEFRGFLRAVNPFYKRIPIDKQDKYLDDIVNTMSKITDSPLGYTWNTGKEYVVRFSYELLIAYAKKS